MKSRVNLLGPRRRRLRPENPRPAWTILPVGGHGTEMGALLDRQEKGAPFPI